MGDVIQLCPPTSPPDSWTVKMERRAARIRADVSGGRLLAGFRLKKRRGIWARSNNEYWPASEQAYSYGWWRYVERFPDGRLVFNSYAYSSSTQRHQSNMLGLLRALGLKIDEYIEAPGGLQDLPRAAAHHRRRAEQLKLEAEAPRRRAHTKQRLFFEADTHLQRARICDELQACRDAARGVAK